MAKWQDQMDRKMYLMREGWQKLSDFMSAQLKWNSKMDARLVELETRVTTLEAGVDAIGDMKTTSVFEEFFGSDRPIVQK